MRLNFSAPTVHAGAGILGLLLLAFASPVLAQDSVWTWSGQITAVSDYRDRGYTLSDQGPALQGELTVAHVSGFYGGVWASTIDDYGLGPDGDGARVEVTLYAGWYGSVSGWDVDVGVWDNRYPDGTDVDYVEFPVRIGRSIGDAAWTLGVIYAPSQTGLGDADNTYLWTRIDYAPTGWPVSISATVGHEDGGFAPDGKVDWTLAAERSIGPATLGVAWVDSDTEDHALVLSVGVGF